MKNITKCVYSLAKFHNDDSKIMLSHSDGSVRIYEMDLNSRKMKLKDQFYYFTSPVICSDPSSDDKIILSDTIVGSGGTGFSFYNKVGPKYPKSITIYFGNRINRV